MEHMRLRQLLPILALSLGVFGIITTEMGVVGLLPELSERFSTPAATTGWLVSIFALVVAITGPFSTLLASRFDRRAVLLTAIAVFALSNTAMALSERFDVAIAFRIIPAIAHPVFFAVALTSAAQLAGPERAGAAITKVFAGVTLGFAFGVPLSSFLTEQFSLEAALLTVAGVNALAFLGILRWLPAMPAEARLSYGSQLRILRRPALWLNIAAVTALFAGMFAGFGFFANYLGEAAGFSARSISVLLAVFGVVMVGGNFVFGALLRVRPVLTAVSFPLVYVALYVAIGALGAVQPAMLALVAFWGLVHSGGLIVSQWWLAVDAHDAPDFGNSLFISFSNLGITIGTAAAGVAMTHIGAVGIPATGAVCAAAAAVLMLVRLAKYPVGRA